MEILLEVKSVAENVKKRIEEEKNKTQKQPFIAVLGIDGDEASKTYTRSARGVKQTDFETNESITTKNIIITFVKNTVLNDGENKDRQNLSNIGTFKGYYITNGKAIEITCEKKDRKSQTIYKD